jgi:hypothetical protein
MFDSIVGLFDERGLPPHGFCLLWDPGLVRLHVISDAIIGFAYYAIPIALGFLLLQRKDFRFGWILAMFGAFILLCGTTHVMDIWVLWNADYGVQGLIKAVTALVSIATAIALWPLVFRVLAMPTSTQFRRVAATRTVA